MSVPEVPQPPSRRPARRSAMRGCLALPLIAIGIVLLLPGLCSLIVMINSSGGAGESARFGRSPA